MPQYGRRRWTVIASGLLCGALALIVLFTNRGAFFSPLAVVVMGAVGLAAVLLQLRLQHRDQSQPSRSPAWLNILGIFFALAAFLGDLMHLGPQLTEALALGAVASFGVSGVIILRSFRKRVAAEIDRRAASPRISRVSKQEKQSDLGSLWMAEPAPSRAGVLMQACSFITAARVKA